MQLLPSIVQHNFYWPSLTPPYGHHRISSFPADSQVQWGAGGTPQPLSSVLGAAGGGGGGYGSALGGASSDDGRHGDDETTEEGGFDYKAAASQLWGDDSEDEVSWRT